MASVLSPVDGLPGLEQALADRREAGLDTWDEWWEGVYRVVTGPSPEHGRLAVRLAAFLDVLAEGAGLHVAAAPVNIGRDEVDARVPDIGVYDPTTPRTSAAFPQTALLVVEIMSPRETPGEKLDFYARWGVREYLELDPRDHSVRLLRREGSVWGSVMRSEVLPFAVERESLAAGERRYEIDWPAPLS